MSVANNSCEKIDKSINNIYNVDIKEYFALRQKCGNHPALSKKKLAVSG